MKKNIAYANPNASQEDIETACKFAAADEFINKLPNKYESFVGENGVKIWRTKTKNIYRKSNTQKFSIILLDETTSSLDTESERIVQNAINNLIKNKTTIVIAHRLSTIHSADRIFVFKNGNVISQGDHKNLMSNCKEYKSLYEKQLK